MDKALLSEVQFKEVVQRTPLFSLDLVVRNKQGKALLGLRTNSPAKGFWFVPGGRVLKGESIKCAFARLLKLELGIADSDVNVKKLGLYEHFYDDSRFDSSISTHYIVNAFEFTLDAALSDLPNSQHSAYRWAEEESLLVDENVHKHTKWYFQPKAEADASFVTSI